jgi:hypothetical protein
LSCLRFLLFFSLISILSLSSEIMSSTHCSLLEWPITVFFVWLKGLFISRVSVWFFFLTPYLCSCLLLYFVLSLLIHISLFSGSLCFNLVFVEVLSEFIYLFMCLLMFVIFGVLKFHECILYILVNHVRYLLHLFLRDFFQYFLFEGFFLCGYQLGSLVTFIIVLLGSGTGYPFSSFLTESCVEFFW